MAYAEERVSGGFYGSSTNEHRCLLSNRAGSTTDAEDRIRSGGRSFATSTSQTSSSCVICNIIDTSSDDGLLGSRGLTSYLSASSLASGSSGVASLPASLSDTLNSDLADLPIVSLFIPALAWADDGEGEEEAEEELNEEVVTDVTGLSPTEFDSESSGEFASDDSSSDDLSEDSEEIDQGEVSSLSAITPLASSTCGSHCRYCPYVASFLNLGEAIVVWS